MDSKMPTYRDLAGKVAVLTGSSQASAPPPAAGWLAAQRRQGDRQRPRPGRAAETVNQIRADGDDAIGVAGDLAELAR